MVGDASGSKYSRSSKPFASELASYISFCNWKATAREILSPLVFVQHYLSVYHFASASPSISPPVLSRLPFPLPTLCSLLFPGRFLTALRNLLTLTVIVVIAIAGMAPSSARCSGILPILIIIIIVDHLIPIQWTIGQQVAWLVVLAACWLNL